MSTEQALQPSVYSLPPTKENETTIVAFNGFLYSVAEFMCVMVPVEKLGIKLYLRYGITPMDSNPRHWYRVADMQDKHLKEEKAEFIILRVRKDIMGNKEFYLRRPDQTLAEAGVRITYPCFDAATSSGPWVRFFKAFCDVSAAGSHNVHIELTRILEDTGAESLTELMESDAMRWNCVTKSPTHRWEDSMEKVEVPALVVPKPRDPSKFNDRKRKQIPSLLTKAADLNPK